MSSRTEGRPREELKHHSKLSFILWILLVFLVVLAAIIKGKNHPHFWLWWEFGALVIATIYTAYFYIGLFVRKDGDQQLIYKGISALIGVVPLLCISAVAFLVCSTVASFIEANREGTIASMRRCLHWLPLPNNHVVTLIFLVLAAICFCSLDFTFARKHSNSKVKQEFRRALYFNGLPVFVAFFALLVFVWRFDDGFNAPDALRSFVGGAVAFETLVSNTVFAILFLDPKI